MKDKLYALLARRLHRPGDSPQTLALKTTLALFTFSVLPPVGGLTLLCHLWDLPVLQAYGLALVGYYTLSLLLLFWIKNHVEWFYYVSQLSALGITMATVVRLGGILQAGGLLFAALASVVFSMVYPRIHLAVLTFLGYAIGVIGLAFAQPFLETAPEMLRPQVNLVFTAINSVWIAVFILLVIFYVFDQRAKNEQAKNQRLRELDELKTRLYTNITHEFRTPLTIILGAANPTLGPSGQSAMPLEGKGGRLDLIRRNANRLLRLVNQMLNLARLEAGAMPVNKVRGNLLPLLRYFLDSFKSMAERKNVRLHLLSNRPALEMDYDPDKIEDILANLLSNAIKFTPPGGDVYITADCLETKAAGPQLVLKVRDTGVGIPPDKLGFIFDRFFQAHTDPPHVEEGSGIGLTLVKEYVKLLGGDISVQSASGKGTEFAITLPITQNAEAGMPVQQGAFSLEEEPEIDFAFALAPATEKSEKPVLLLVEDNPELRHYLHTFTAPHYQVQLAHNGEEGITRALELVPDVIISDVMMPVKDGFELCRTLKNDFRTNHIPIVLLTARVDTESKLAGLEKGADVYMAKPFQPKELLLRLRKLIELREKLKIKYSLSRPETAAGDRQPTGLDEVFFKEIHKHLEANYSNEDFGIEALCTAMNISRVQLHRKLIALRGQSASHFINGFRLEKACALLRTTRKTISEIAYEVGFRDANYFTKVFAKTYGSTPSEWRQGS